MNTINSRRTLQSFAARHAGTMPEMDAIRRADTVREIREIKPAFYVPQIRESRTPSSGGFAALLLSALVGAFVLWVFLTLVLA